MTDRIRARSVLSAAACCLAAVLATCISTPGVEAQVVTAHVDLEIDDASFDFPAVHDPSVPNAVERTVCEVVNGFWKLFDWQPAPTAPAGGEQPDLNWVVTIEVRPHQVEDQSGSVHIGFNVNVTHRVKIGSQFVTLDQSRDTTKLYDYRDGLPGPDEVDRVIEDLDSLLESQLRSLRVTPELHQLMGQVQLVDRVISDEAHHRIVVPVRYDDLVAVPDDSKLRVTMMGDQIPNHNGRMDLEISGQVWNDSNLEGFVVGPIIKVVPQGAGVDPIQLPQDWHQHFATLIEDATDISVFLLKYVPAVGTINSSDGVEYLPNE
jgi:hypothetical protein